MQKKAVIYIDVEDDITAVIGKVKAAKEKIVALVPPKRTGMLQSAVNLRLLARTADAADKRIVLITSSQALASLAASAKIPVAKSLQSPPKLVEVSDSTKAESNDGDDETDKQDDVIEGGDLPVGEHAGLKDEDDEEIIVPGDLAALDMDSDGKAKKSGDDKKQKQKQRINVPDFGSFRKKVAIGGVGFVLLVAFLVWANVFAPHATVILSAKTSPVDIKTTLSVGDTLVNDATKNTLTTITEKNKSTQEIVFTATGKKEVGTKASGTVVLNNCQSAGVLTVSAGTYVSYNGMNYVLQSSVEVPGGQDTNFDFDCDTPGQSDPVTVIAEDIGDEYNVSSGESLTVAGYSADMTASVSDDISGGDKHNATVVGTADVKTALDELKQQSTDDEKQKLKDLFGSDVVLIEDSFAAVEGAPKITPGIGEEVSSGQAKLVVQITYSMMAVSKDAIEGYLDEAISQQLGGDESKRVYDTGMSTVQFSEFQAA